MYVKYIFFDTDHLDCVWGPWSVFSQCDKSCGGGKMFKTRTKLVTEQYGGTCPGWDKVIKNCNPEPCPGKSLFIHLEYFANKRP